MKIRVTFEVDDTDRIAISLLKNGTFKSAPRETIEEWLKDTVDVRLSRLRRQFEIATQDMFEALDVYVNDVEMNTEEENQ
jgi:hypothetical protein